MPLPAREAAAPRRARRLSLDYLTVSGAGPIEHVEAAAAAGFDSVGLRFLAPTDLRLEHEVVGDRRLVRAIAAACRRTGITPLDVEVFFLGPGVDMDRLRAAAEAAAEIGASSLLAVCMDRDRQRALDAFAALCDVAAAGGMTVALEFMRWSPVPTIEAAVAFVADAGRANGAVCIDALHLARSGGDPSALPALPPGTLVQLCDAPAAAPPPERLLAEARTDRRYPGEGGLPLGALLAALPPETPVSIEVPHRDHADRTVQDRARLAGEALRSWLGRQAGDA
jgi:sugar phosphate isomerase/epimerase